MRAIDELLAERPQSEQGLARDRKTPHAAEAGGKPMRVLAVGAPKGGVGKTTTSLYLATRLAERLGGTRERSVVGLLDRDHSRHLTRLVELREELLRPGVTLIEGTALPPPDCGLEMIVIDTPPGLAAIDSLQAAQMVLVPVQLEDQGVASLVDYLDDVDMQRIAVSPQMRLLAVLPTMVDGRTLMHRQRLKDVMQIAGAQRPPLPVLPPVPRRSRIMNFDLSAVEYDAAAKELFDHAYV
ncbi:MAG: ParA family protein [Chloroflexota bacterium]|nr:ParA family protein [Chloroflexota bacterium]